MNMQLLNQGRRKSEELERDLHEALIHKKFFLEYQPIVSNLTGKVIGLEALLRMNTHQGRVPPSDFIPYAESSGLIDEIGMWVLEESCFQAARLFEKFNSEMPYISVNVSMVQLERPDFADRTFQKFLSSGAPVGSICLEVTESVFSTNRIAVRNNLETLQKQGFRIFIDDFGTGYSTLINLIHFPFDKIKVDKAFIDNIQSDYKSREVVSGIIKIAEALGKRLIIEGVETEHQFWELMKLGCDSTQGYLFSRPLPMEQVEKMITDDLSVKVKSSEGVHYALYISQSEIPESEVQALVEQCRLNNLNSGLTGFLLYSNGSFMQYLEGREEIVKTLLEKIKQDPRHTNMRSIVEGTLTTRLYPEWSMGFWSLDNHNNFYSVNENPEVLSFPQWKSRTLDLMQVSLEPTLCRALFLSLSPQEECVTCLNKSVSCFNQKNCAPNSLPILRVSK